MTNIEYNMKIILIEEEEEDEILIKQYIHLHIDLHFVIIIFKQAPVIFFFAFLFLISFFDIQCCLCSLVTKFCFCSSLHIVFAYKNPRQLTKGYTTLFLPIIEPGLSIALQPIYALWPTIAPILLRFVVIVFCLCFYFYFCYLFSPYFYLSFDSCLLL